MIQIELLEAPAPTLGALVLEAIQIEEEYLAIRQFDSSIGQHEASELLEVIDSHAHMFDRLRTLDIHNNVFDLAGIAGISLMLLNLPSLTSLSMDDNNLGDDGLEIIANAMSTNQSVTSLGLQLNGIGDRGAESIARMLRVNTKMRLLYLNGNAIGDSGAAAIAQVLTPYSATSTSTSTSTGNTSTSDSSCGTNGTNNLESPPLSSPRSCNTSLVMLSLGSNSIGDQGCRALASALTCNRSLTVLLLNGNSIGDDGAMALAAALEHNRTLTCLNLHLTAIQRDGERALVECLANHNTLLTTLNISKSDGSQDEYCDDIFALAATNARLANVLRDASSGALDRLAFAHDKSDNMWLTQPKATLLCERLLASPTCLRTLTRLDLSSCRLSVLPNLLPLKNTLIELDVSRNRLRNLPDWLTDMTSLRTLSVIHNPDLLLPPERIQNEGCDAILKFLREIKGGVEYKRLKLLVLGHGGAGKTSLLYALQQLEQSIARPVFSWFQLAYNTLSGNQVAPMPPPLASPLNASAGPDLLPSEPRGRTHQRTRSSPSIQSTIGIDTDAETLILDPTIKFTLYDFAGQLQYITTHQYFLSVRYAIYVIVVDLSLPIAEQEQHIKHWLHFLQYKLPLYQQNGFSTPLRTGTDDPESYMTDPELLDSELPEAELRDIWRFGVSILLVGTKFDTIKNSPSLVHERRLLYERIMRESPLPIVCWCFVTGIRTQVLGADRRETDRLLDTILRKIAKSAREMMNSEHLSRVPKYYTRVASAIESGGGITSKFFNEMLAATSEQVLAEAATPAAQTSGSALSLLPSFSSSSSISSGSMSSSASSSSSSLLALGAAVAVVASTSNLESRTSEPDSATASTSATTGTATGTGTLGQGVPPRVPPSSSRLFLQVSDILQNRDCGLSESEICGCLEYLHAIGVIVMDTASGVICSRPQVLAKLMSIFVCPVEHLEMLLGREVSSTEVRGSIVSKSVVIQRVNAVLQAERESVLESADEIEQFFSLMERLELCFSISARAAAMAYGIEGVLFPMLRPEGHLFLLPPAAVSSEVPTAEPQEDIRWIGRQWRCSRVGVPLELFFRLQLQLREWHDPRYKLYRNGVLLEQPDSRCRALVVYIDADSNARSSQALISWENDSDDTSAILTNEAASASIVAVAIGPVEGVRTLMRELRARIEQIQEQQLRGLNIVELRLCSRCCQVPGLYEPLMAALQPDDPSSLRSSSSGGGAVLDTSPERSSSIPATEAATDASRTVWYPLQRSLLFADEPPPSDRLMCRMGHELLVAEWENGSCSLAPRTSSSDPCWGHESRDSQQPQPAARRNWWDPVSSEQLLQECRWYDIDRATGAEVQVKLDRTPTWHECLQHGYVGYTTLTATSTSAACVAEYQRVKKWFDKFVSRDDDAEFVLERVEFIFNARLEQQFEEYFRGILEREMLQHRPPQQPQQQHTSPTLSATQAATKVTVTTTTTTTTTTPTSSTTLSSTNIVTSELTTSPSAPPATLATDSSSASDSTVPVVTRRSLPHEHGDEDFESTLMWNKDDTPYMHQQRQWVIQQLEKYVVRVSGNEQVNLLMAWHGTSRPVCQKIARSNFYLPAPLDENTIVVRDEGFYGRGIYLSGYPSYSDYYIRQQQIKRRDEVAKRSYQLSITDPAELARYLEQQKQQVEEEWPLLLCWTLLGKPYPVVEDPLSDLHLPLRLRKNLHGKPQVEGYDSHYVLVNSRGYPAALHEQPAADEIVLFSRSQILPRYLVYYRRCEAFRILWVDSSHQRNQDVVAHLRTLLAERHIKLVVAALTTASQLRQWLASNRLKARRQARKNKLLFVTNTIRRQDGGTLAAHTVCEWLRAQYNWRETPIVVLTRGRDNLQLSRQFRGVRVTSQMTELVAIVLQMLDNPGEPDDSGDEQLL